MNEYTKQLLIELNKAFYRRVSKDFSDSRNYYWDGWEVMWSVIGEDLLTINKYRNIRVLDVGCGNGRLFNFLVEQDLTVDYVGVDFVEDMLETAKENTGQSDSKQHKVNYIKADITEFIKRSERDDYFAQQGGFDLITLFGLIHHIPGQKTRAEFISSLIANYLGDNGFLVTTFWQFIKSQRFTDRALKGKKALLKLREWASELYGDVSADKNLIILEENDYLLDWRRGKKAFRYCHNFSDEEIDTQIEKFSETVKVVSDYRSDGKKDPMNRYIIFSRETLR